MADLHLTVDDHELSASWTDDNPETRAAIADGLPLSGDASRWGDELYFTVPVDVAPENARASVRVGAVAYWPGGDALCVFWGPTPASHGDEPRAAAPVNVVATIANVDPLATLEGGARITVERA